MFTMIAATTGYDPVTIVSPTFNRTNADYWFYNFAPSRFQAQLKNDSCDPAIWVVVFFCSQTTITAKQEGGRPKDIRDLQVQVLTLNDNLFPWYLFENSLSVADSFRTTAGVFQYIVNAFASDSTDDDSVDTVLYRNSPLNGCLLENRQSDGLCWVWILTDSESNSGSTYWFGQL